MNDLEMNRQGLVKDLHPIPAVKVPATFKDPVYLFFILLGALIVVDPELDI